MAFNSNGQIQYLILDSLSTGSKYGLEIIEYISKKTDGGYILKKPTLYSCLTRLEKKGLVSSSFWGESEFGGKRHYYSLTDEGKESLRLLSKEFENVSFTQNSSPIINNTQTQQEEIEEIEESKPIFLEQKNLFDLTQPEKPIQKEEQPIEKSDIVQNQIDIFSYTPPKEQEIKEEKKDDARLLSEQETLTPSQLAQNKKIYDTSSDLKKYRNRKSFSDNQIEMSVVYENKPDDEEYKAKIASLKQSILQTKQNNFDRSVYSNLFNQNTETEKQEEKKPEIYQAPQSQSPQKTQLEELAETKDDAVLITNPKIEDEKIPYQKRITPPNIEINVSDDNLPAPIRDSNLEPTYKDMMSKIIEKKKEKTPAKEEIKIETNIETSSFADFESLKNYYRSQGLDFKEYKKSNVERIHNTYFLNFAISLFLLLLSGVGSAIIFWIVSASSLLMTSTNFVYYTIPILFAIYTIYALIKFKCQVSRKASQKYNSIVNWAVFVLACIVVFVINVCCGMQAETMANYLTSLLVPIYALLLILPVNYYVTKFVYKKFAK